MRIYLDDDSAHPLLVRLLRQAGHDVVLPADVDMVGKADPVHLIFASREERVLLSRNYRDFQDLHDLIMQTRGHHPGIFIVRRDNGGKRNLDKLRSNPDSNSTTTQMFGNYRQFPRFDGK